MRVCTFPPPATPAPVHPAPERSSAMAKVSKGSIFRRPRSSYWFIKFWVDGKRYRESTETDDRERAIAFLNKRLREAKEGRLVSAPERVTFEQMHELLLTNYRFKRNKTDPSRHVMRLAESFAGMPGEDITEDRIAEYSRK